MKVDELKLDNLVIYEETTHKIVSLNESERIESRWIGQPEGEKNYIHSLSECKPISLTKELMKQFGFTFKPIGPSGSIITRHTGYWQKDGIAYFAGSRIKDQVDIFLQLGDGIDIVYVHQLQNMYYELTKQKLYLK